MVFAPHFMGPGSLVRQTRWQVLKTFFCLPCVFSTFQVSCAAWLPKCPHRNPIHDQGKREGMMAVLCWFLEITSCALEEPSGLFRCLRNQNLLLHWENIKVFWAKHKTQSCDFYLTHFIPISMKTFFLPILLDCLLFVLSFSAPFRICGPWLYLLCCYSQDSKYWENYLVSSFLVISFPLYCW